MSSPSIFSDLHGWWKLYFKSFSYKPTFELSTVCPTLPTYQWNMLWKVVHTQGVRCIYTTEHAVKYHDLVLVLDNLYNHLCFLISYLVA